MDLVTLDLSFISIAKVTLLFQQHRQTAGLFQLWSRPAQMASLQVLPAVMDLLKPTGQLLTLIKPQFEAASAQVSARNLCHSIVSDFLYCLRLS